MWSIKKMIPRYQLTRIRQISFPISVSLHQAAKIRAIVEKMDLRDWIIGLMKKEKRKMSKLFDLSQNDPLEPEYDPFHAWPYDHRVRQAQWTILWMLVVLLLCFIASCSHKYHQTGFARGYSNEAIVEAIKKAEGGWTYGIKTIPCRTQVQCHAIALACGKEWF